VGREALAGLSGHGSSPQERRAKPESEQDILAGDILRALKPTSQSFIDNTPGICYFH